MKRKEVQIAEKGMRGKIVEKKRTEKLMVVERMNKKKARSSEGGRREARLWAVLAVKMRC